MSKENRITTYDVILNETNEVETIEITLAIPAKEIKDKGVSSLYDPILDTVANLEDELKEYGFFKNK